MPSPLEPRGFLLLAVAALALGGCRGSEPGVATAPPAKEVAPPDPPPPPKPTGWIQVCGTLDADKPDYTFNGAKIEEFEIDPRESVSHLPGPFTMALLDAAGRTLSKEEFGPMWGHAASVGPDGTMDCHPVQVPFSCMNLPFVPGAETIEVRRGGAVLERYTRSRNAPQIRITAPAAGDRLPKRGGLKIAWEAGDADGDALLHTIYYRAGEVDGGLGPWSAVIGDFRDTSMELDVSLFPRGPAPELMVLTTDGFNTARATLPLSPP